jgi:hypothetical protein
MNDIGFATLKGAGAMNPSVLDCENGLKFRVK